MGTKVQGGMYCNSCAKPVAAQKGTSRMRNTFALGATVLSAGMTLGVGAKTNSWHCPFCGGPVVKTK
ncbi:hypothetical protein [Rhodococcus wratislaviensis]|uniref:Uncharacterized protein n=1 Tax=Rhodococcus wratislaviensis NBRC 100605 TaxID=1219028 RepID=X0QC44_RHOWR|nr:hypothetical protein [Rhodococcus wratislaviensis]GAF49157.1 hypothetical protein RW1_069_00250 [Rhodococcus wratislaviensis NBRC 100605]